MYSPLLSPVALVLAGLLDWFMGDPSFIPHPVRFVGRLIELLERAARRYFTNPKGLKSAGLLLLLLTAAFTVLPVYGLLYFAYRFHPAAGFIVELYIYFSVLAAGDLRNHVFRVMKAFERKDIDKARSATAMIVSRETAELKESDLSRAALESLFENSADGFVAPLFYAVIGGPVLAVLYKTASTLDSMIGYKNYKYRYLGSCSARFDDILNFIPARLTAFLLVIASLPDQRAKESLGVLVRDHDKHESPNSAWPEAAAAGSLGIRFGGIDYHRGAPVERPLINAEGKEASAVDLKRGLRLYGRMVVLAYLLLLILAGFTGIVRILI